MSVARHLELAREYLSAGEYDKAMKAVRHVMATKPDNLDAMLLAAWLVRRGGNLPGAEALYLKIIEFRAEPA